MKETSTFFKALSDPNRLRILNMLKSKTLCLCEITEILNLAPSTVSQHLSILKKAGFLAEKRDGKWANYFIDPHPSDERITAFMRAVDFWIGDSKIVEDDLNKCRSVSRFNICKG